MVAFPDWSPRGLNLVEGWFAEVTDRKLRRSARCGGRELEMTLMPWIADGTRTRNRSCESKPPAKV
ncbi:hypothetical protein SAMN05421854_108374 [Amycolatopsis rubida]|uniref:Uncharacterized protein n=1 Tax=Amycolatopsis rubida TaxID=112413 RepID=A0A1I5VIP3_9PSEU|nr:hypothetical protein SAMN05421854_108374 [Amycolatopsis rubida]